MQNVSPRVAVVRDCFALASSAAPEQSPPEGRSVLAEMHNVMYHFTDSSAVHIVYLEGELVPTTTTGIPVFDDPNSFGLDILTAQISIATGALANGLNQYAFAAPDAPIKEVRISAQGGKLNMRGRLHSKGNIPFESVGSLSVNTSWLNPGAYRKGQGGASSREGLDGSAGRDHGKNN